MASSRPLDGLAPYAYARDHAAFEALSNQRGLIADWLVHRLGPSLTAPLSILAVGCGDGSLDAVVAERLLAGDSAGCALRYVGVEPFAASAGHFRQRMGRIDTTRLSFDTVVAPFAKTDLDEIFDDLLPTRCGRSGPSRRGAVAAGRGSDRIERSAGSVESPSRASRSGHRGSSAVVQ
jgi:SAM-dependent methyltransferase